MVQRVAVASGIALARHNAGAEDGAGDGREPINGLGVDQAIVQALEREPGRRAARSVHAMRSKACAREDSRRRSSAAFLKFEVDRQLELECIQLCHASESNSTRKPNA